MISILTDAFSLFEKRYVSADFLNKKLREPLPIRAHCQIFVLSQAGSVHRDLADSSSAIRLA
jgi:hypothetical protein